MFKTIRTDVTAVKNYKNTILAGIGSIVHIYDKCSARLLQQIHALEGQKIYGFIECKESNKVLVFGGKQFAIVTLHDNVASLLMKAVVCDDWLHSALWCDEDTVALLTAHNTVQKWSISSQSLLLEHHSKDNSILYSGLLLPLKEDLLVLAGTVFSEVIIHRCGLELPLHHLRGHKGVIFSISCDPQKSIIVTTSDDRSVRIWHIDHPTNPPTETIDFWTNCRIFCTNEVYGHTARVMRNCITSDYIISVGEDSTICFWSYQGMLVRKCTAHQNGGVWSVDADDKHLVTGGGDCGVTLHPLTVASGYGVNDVIEIKASTPKKVAFTARRNLVILTEDDLIYYNVSMIKEISYKIKHESSCKLLSVSFCKQIVAVADMNGKLDVFVENCKDEASLIKLIDVKLDIDKILSLHWADNRHLVVCAANGEITVLVSKGSTIDEYGSFSLPHCKERWLTAAAIDVARNLLIVGDRCGNIHAYENKMRDPFKSFSKVHGRYGPTSITIKHNDCISTGRDGTIKTFHVGLENTIKYMNSNQLEFPWVEKFLDKNGNIVCGFQERVFVVYDARTNSKLLEVACGGGHRSWDAVRYIDKIANKFEEIIKLVYVKNSEIHTVQFELSKIVSRNVVNGSHSKEINCLKAHRPADDISTTYFFSGGEDTTLRISSVSKDLKFQDEMVFKQLSSIKTLKLYDLNDNSALLLSAGGRAQICINTLTFKTGESKVISQELVDYLIKGTDKERKGNKTWRDASVDFDPETRIMDLDALKVDDDSFLVVAGCSDAVLRVFSFKLENKQFKLLNEIKHHKTCILKICFMYTNEKSILVSCTTRGEITFWNVNVNNTIEPSYTMIANKSGINCISSNIISSKTILVATGGDDNTIILNLIEIPDQRNMASIKVLHSWSSSQFHSSQITGLRLLDGIMVSTSIDQRVTLCRWQVSANVISCQFVRQIISDVSDIQGMDVLDNCGEYVEVCVFGKGMEVVRIHKGD